MNRIVILGLVLGLVVAAAPAAGQQDTVTLEVQVVDSDGDPVGGATVQATWDGGESSARTTTASGRVLVDVPNGADVDIHVTHDDYIRNIPYSVPDAGAETVQVSVFRKSTATVVVTDAAGNAVENARVTLRKRGAQTAQGNTGGQGQFSTDTIEAGEYEVSVFRTGYLRTTNTVSVSGDQRVNVTIERSSVLVTFRVVDDHTSPPTPVEGAQVPVERVGSTLTTNENGENTVQVPVNSAFSVTVNKQGYESATQQVRVGEEAREVQFVISRNPAVNITAANERIVAGESVRVTVTDEYGDPISNAVVTLDGSQAATTNGQGVADVTIEAEGSHQLAASAEGIQSESITVQAISEGSDSTPTDTATGTPTASATPTESIVEQIPGFGLAPALVGVLLVAAVLLARRD